MSTVSKFNLFQNVQNLDSSDALSGYDRVYLYYGTDSSGNALEVYYPDDASYVGNGTTLEVSVDMLPANKTAVQIATDIYNSIVGYNYQPYTATGALLDPSAEIGDGVDINGMYSGIYCRGTKFGKLMCAEISAPIDEEVEHEYGVQKVTDRSYNRSMIKVNSSIIQQASEISAKVEANYDGGSSSMSWTLHHDEWVVKYGGTEVFKVTEDGAYVKGIINADSGKIGLLNLANGKLFTDGAEDYSGDWTSGFHLSSSGMRLGSNFKVSSSGYVEATGMTIKGSLNFENGDSINGNTISNLLNSVNNNQSTWSSGASGGLSYVTDKNNTVSGIEAKVVTIRSALIVGTTQATWQQRSLKTSTGGTTVIHYLGYT